MELYPEEIKGLGKLINELLPILSKQLDKAELTTDPIKLYDSNGEYVGSLDRQPFDSKNWKFVYGEAEEKEYEIFKE